MKKKAMTRACFRFYNVRVGRSPKVVGRELRAICLAHPRPLVVGLCETVGYELPDIPGYKLLRDRSTRSRANIAAYVDARHEISEVRWLDQEETWGRTQHAGEHEARVTLQFLVDDTQVLVGHQAPRGTDNTVAAQTEGINTMIKAMAPWTRRGFQDRLALWRAKAKDRPRLVMMDVNRPHDVPGPGAWTLARAIGGKIFGQRILCMVARNVELIEDRYPTKVEVWGETVQLESDHGCMFEAIVKVPSEFLDER